MLASAVGTRAAAREKDRYNSARVLVTSLPSPCGRKTICNKELAKTALSVVKSCPVLILSLSVMQCYTLGRDLSIEQARTGLSKVRTCVPAYSSLDKPEVTLHPEDV